MDWHMLFTDEMAIVWRWLGFLAGTLLLLALAAWGGKHAALQIRALARALSGRLVPAVDEPTDEVVRGLTALLTLIPALRRRHLQPRQVSIALLPVARALQAGLDGLLARLEDTPSDEPDAREEERANVAP